ncbi:MAG TPA: DUF444 family protein, partial [Nitrososphaeraceae archaeon]
MTNIVDKRFMPKDGNIVDRQKFIQRYKAQIKKTIRKTIESKSIKDFQIKGQKIKVNIPQDDLNLPEISIDHDDAIWESVQPGNKKFETGDKIEKRKVGAKGTGGSNTSNGESDDFEFTLTDEEFSNLFFEDLELPELIKKRFNGDSYETQRCGYSNTGGPSSLNLKQTIIKAFARACATKDRNKDSKEVIEECLIAEKTKKKKFILDDSDLRYNYRDKVEIPSTRAVMFCLMDVSASMGETEKDMAKRFFILLSLFLKRNYDIIDIIFIRHADWAEECEESVFFYDPASGGTVISSGYTKIHEIIQSRYNPEMWNIYIAQATDGDN